MYKTKLKGKTITGTYQNLVEIINMSGLLGSKIEKI